MSRATSRLLVLDNEAVQAVRDPGHRRHRHAVALLEASVGGGRRRGGLCRWSPPPYASRPGDRSAPHAAAVDRLQTIDVPLDAAHADRAAVLRGVLGASVTDAHLGATVAGPGTHHGRQDWWRYPDAVGATKVSLIVRGLTQRSRL